MSDLSDFYGPNAGYVLELYDRYRLDPNSVDPETRAFFSHWSPPAEAETPSARQPAAPPHAGAAGGIPLTVAAARIARRVRVIGHLDAHLDPLGSEPPGDPGLKLATNFITPADLERLPASTTDLKCPTSATNALQALVALRKAYCGTIGYEMGHLQSDEEREWFYLAIESGRFWKDFTPEDRRHLLERLTEVDTFEQFIHRVYFGAKRFSIEGSDMMVPMIDEIIRHSALGGMREVVLAMAHRGRLNVLAHVLGKPYEAILTEFQSPRSGDADSVAGRGSDGWTGDVKYHLGALHEFTGGLSAMPVTLVPNPSHLEYVNPVAEGHTRAAQDRRDRPGPPVQDDKASLALLIHGDASFPGQGIVSETLNLSRIAGYSTGGTIHIVANNQIGFTTLPRDGRSTLYCSDLAKGFDLPVVHVNADDPEACIVVTRMACAYREQFRKDFVIDLVGYRRHGHNEGDDPFVTQPMMYKVIESHPRVRDIWAQKLELEGAVSKAEADAMVAAAQERLMQARTRVEEERAPAIPRPIAAQRAPHTAVSAETLAELNEALLARPPDFTPNPKLEERVFQKRRQAVRSGKGIDWGTAESLAFASILADGVPIRLTGQDSQRGTFGQRNSVLHDPESGRTYTPLQHLPMARASFAVYNSPLSENAVIGFEYGYSMHAPGVLVLWEAQYGDFANAAQVFIDQFLVSGNAKWRQIPSLVLLLPHGYEGAGPEHSSARIERYLQLCADNNIRVANCTSAAQYFHLLRRQALMLYEDPKPLVAMTPKSLLRHPLATATLAELAEGAFQPLIDDSAARMRARSVKRVVLCSGKVYVDLMAARKSLAEGEEERLAVLRLEELYPFPDEAIRQALRGYPNAQELVWVQEEPANMGAWLYVAPRLRDPAIVGWSGELIYAGRAEAASPAEGSEALHREAQSRLIGNALKEIPPPAGVKRTKVAM